MCKITYFCLCCLLLPVPRMPRVALKGLLDVKSDQKASDSIELEAGHGRRLSKNKCHRGRIQRQWRRLE